MFSLLSAARPTTRSYTSLFLVLPPYGSRGRFPVYLPVARAHIAHFAASNTIEHFFFQSIENCCHDEKKEFICWCPHVNVQVLCFYRFIDWPLRFDLLEVERPDIWSSHHACNQVGIFRIPLKWKSWRTADHLREWMVDRPKWRNQFYWCSRPNVRLPWYLVRDRVNSSG